MVLIASPLGLLSPALVLAVPLNQKSTAPNQPPVLTAPASINVTEDTEARVAVGVSDPDVDADFDGMLKLTVQVHNGTVILPTTVGLSFLVGAGGTPGAAGHSLVSFVASQAHAQDALRALLYRPKLHFHGTDRLNLLVNDQGFTGTGGALSLVSGYGRARSDERQASLRTLPD